MFTPILHNVNSMTGRTKIQPGFGRKHRAQVAAAQVKPVILQYTRQQRRRRYIEMAKQIDVPYKAILHHARTIQWGASA